MHIIRLFFLIACIISSYMTFIKAGFISTMLFYMLILLALIDGLLLLMSIFTFRLKHQLDKTKVNKGEHINYQIAIDNITPFVLAPLTIEYEGSDMLFKDNLLDTKTRIIYPFQTEYISQSLHCNYRGTYKIGLKCLSFESFFKLFNYKFKKVEVNKVTVYPKIYNFQRIKATQPINPTIESLLCLDKLDKTNFKEVRAYHLGDPLNKIHWKLSAKNEHWMTKAFEGNLNQNVKVFINNERTSHTLVQRIILEDHMIESVVALVKHYLDNGIKTQMFWYDEAKMHLSGTSEQDFGVFFKALTDMNFLNHKEPFSKYLQSEVLDNIERDAIIIFSPTLSLEFVNAIIKCAKSDFKVFLLLNRVSHTLLEQGKIDYDPTLIYLLLDNHVSVLVPHLEGDQCRLEVMQ